MMTRRFLPLLFCLMALALPVSSVMLFPGSARAVAPSVYHSDLPGSTVQTYGVKGDGTTDDRAKLAALATQTGRRYHFAKGTYRIASNLTLPNTSAWHFPPGAKLKPLTGVTITLPETLEAGAYAIFDFSGGGSIKFSCTPTLRPEWFGASTDGVTDSSVAFQKAIDALCHSTATNGTLLLGNATYRISTTLSIFRDRIHIRGEGKNVSLLQFEPTAGTTLLEFKHPTNPLYQLSLKGVGISSTETSVAKTAISLVDVREIVLNDIAIRGSGTNGTWSGGAGSIGLKTAGRDTSVYDDLTIYADRPIVLSPNTRSGVTDYDFDSNIFRDLYLVGSGSVHPIIEALDAVSLTNLHFEGRQSWAFGSHGFYYVSTTHGVSPYNISIKNVRWEQSTSVTGHVIHIDASGLHNLLMENVAASGRAAVADRDTQGFYFRNAKRVRMESCIYVAARTSPELSPPETLVALDVDHTVDELVLENCFFNSGSTLSLGGLILAEGRSRDRLNRTTTLADLLTTVVYTGHYTYMRFVSPLSAYGFVDQNGVKVWRESGRVASANTITAGTVTWTNGSKAVVGTGTSFAADDAGKLILDSGSNRYVIDSVTDGTHLTLKSPYTGSTAPAATYTLWRGRVHIPVLNSYKVLTVHVSAAGATRTESGTFVVNRAATTPYGGGTAGAAHKVAATPGCDLLSVGGTRLQFVFETTSSLFILNNTGETLDYTIRAEYQ